MFIIKCYAIILPEEGEESEEASWNISPQHEYKDDT